MDPRRSNEGRVLCYSRVCPFCSQGCSGPAAQAEPIWTTYHRDAQRSGYDPEATQPIEPQLAWQSVDLGAPIWSQTLVLGDRVYVATVGRNRALQTMLVLLADKSFGPKKGNFSLTLHLDRRAMTLLRRHHDHLNLQVRISAPGYIARRVQAVLR